MSNEAVITDGYQSKASEFLAHIIRDTFPNIKNCVTVGGADHGLAHALRSPEHAIEAWHLDIESSTADCDLVRLWPAISVGDHSFFGVGKFDLVVCFNYSDFSLRPYIVELAKIGAKVLFIYSEPTLLLESKEATYLKRYSFFKHASIEVVQRDS